MAVNLDFKVTGLSYCDTFAIAKCLYKSCYGSYFPDVIIYSQFHSNRLRVFDSVRSRISLFPAVNKVLHCGVDCEPDDSRMTKNENV